jgi:aspartyl-tRNA(Asn)/glutamyl-tRNA(Gln) amidotransferase subunit A
MSSAKELHFLAVAEGAARLAAGTLTSREWLEAILARIAQVDGLLHSYITIDTEGARRAADQADAERRRFQARSAMHGVPLGLKDAVETAGLRTTGHSRRYIEHVPTRDAALVARLRAAGAVIIGKHALYELCYGGPSFDLPWPPARNPWNTARIPGGSSSGTGAAIAAGLAPCGIGTDTGGSIRQPATYCGIAGLKPTHRLVPIAGVMPLTFTMDDAGPMAWTAEDCAVLLDAIAGTSCADAVARMRDLEGLRIGVLRGFFDGSGGATANATTTRTLDAAFAVLERLGARLVDIELPDLRDFDACGRTIVLAESYATHEAQLRRDPMIYGQLGRHRFTLGAFIDAVDLVHAERLRRRLRRAVDDALTTVDVIVTASDTGAAPRFDDQGAVASFPFVAVPSLRIPFNVTGHPALSVCCGFDDDGMSLGLQLVAARNADARVLAVGAAYERAAGWRARRPAL